MASIQGSFEWFRDVVGLPGEGIVLKNTCPHLCGGRYLEKTLTTGDASDEEGTLCLRFMRGRHSLIFGCHPDTSLRLFLIDLFRRVYQVNVSVLCHISCAFALGVFAQVQRDLKVNWAALVVITCHGKKKTFFPHPLWAGLHKAATDNMDRLLLACTKSLVDSEVLLCIQDVVQDRASPM